jgi:hypothetical protein
MEGASVSAPQGLAVSDERSITNLLAEYAESLDSGDFVGLGGLFAHGIVRFEGGDERFEGAASVGGMYAALVQVHGGDPETKHVMTNIWVDIDGDSASSRSYFTVIQAHDDLALQIISAGRYHDKFERLDGEWCFRERIITRDFVGDLRYHLQHDPYRQLSD